jgi:hypothetical protein
MFKITMSGKYWDLLNKGVTVAPHTRDGHHVDGYTRSAAPKTKTTLKATHRQFMKMNEEIEHNMAYLVYMGKQIAGTHGIQPMFENGRAVGDLGDLIAEGKMGMLIGGMEWMKTRTKAKKKGEEPAVDMLTQMKTRAKQRMRLMAKKLKNTVALPRDLTKHLAILASAREKYRQSHNGIEPSDEDLADMITLHKRSDKGPVEYSHEEKLDRIKALAEYKNSQYVDELDLNELHLDEDDPTFWTKWTSAQREQRKQVNKIVDRLIAEGKLDPMERSVLYLRFYIDDPGRSYGMNVRSFESIARRLDGLRGMKRVRLRKKRGDNVKFKPTKRVEIKTKRGKPTGKYKTVRYKSEVSMKILKVNKDHFILARTMEPGKKTWRVGGKPPFKNVKTNKADVWGKYQSGMKKILSHADATSDLRAALDLTEKSLSVSVPLTRRFVILS